MCADRGYTIRPYAGGHLISGHRFCLPVQHLAYVTAEQLNAPWLDDPDEQEKLDAIEATDLGIEALDGLVEEYE